MKSMKTAKDITNEVRSKFLKQLLANNYQLQRILTNMGYLGKDNVTNFLLELEKTVSELQNCGGNSNNKEIVKQLLSAIPETL